MKKSKVAAISKVSVDKPGVYETDTQIKNMAWVLPRPDTSHYKGGMPLHCEKWLLTLACDVLKKYDVNVLNLFSGACKHGLRLDILPDTHPDVCGDAHEVGKILKGFKFDIVLADPPYSTEESEELYGTGKISYKTWTQSCTPLIKKGGLLIVYHKFLMPNPNSDVFRVSRRVFIAGRPYHLPRVAVFYRKRIK